MSILYVFLDHAGELKFISQSNRYFTLASLCTWDPSDFAADYYRLKHSLVMQDVNGAWDHQRFHAAEDPVWVRDAFMRLIQQRTDFRVDAVSVRKNRIYAIYQPPHVFYPHMTRLLLKFVLPQVLAERPADRIEVVLDQFPLKGLDRQTFLQKMSSQISKLAHPIPHSLRFHYSYSHPHLQAVDYCAWATYRTLERGDYTWVRLLENVIRSRWEYAARTSHTTY